jgi:heme O synthase-like polyprenyltransferase
VKDFADLSKFRLSSLVVFTTSAGFLCAGSPIDIYSLFAASSGTALCAASAGTFNQVLEKERDKKMKRTCHRPLPSGRISSEVATVWGLATGSAGIGGEFYNLILLLYGERELVVTVSEE